MPNSQCKQRLRERGICVIIPTYNNVGTIRDVLTRSFAYCSDIIVVNDGSNDGTEEILRKIPGIVLVDYPDNAGKGTALKRGFRKALTLGFSYAITLDADGQHYPEDIPAFLEGNIKHPGSLIVGQRDLKNVERSQGSAFANSFSNFWVAVQTWQYLPDTQTGYRLYPLHKLHGLSVLTSRYEAELELLVFASWNGVKIVSIPVNVYYPPRQKRVSHFQPGRDFARISLLNSALCVLALVYGLPLAIIRGLYTTTYTLFSLTVYLGGALGVLTPFARVWIPIAKALHRPPTALHAMLHWFGKTVVRLFPFFGVKVNINNKHHHDFSAPAIIICNHQSHLDLIAQLSLTQKIVFLTNDWVWKSPYFGYVVRNAECFPVSMGIEKILPRLKELVTKGYSISIFPEGTRSADCTIGRFHKGAFVLAKELGLDIVPLILYGTGKVLPKKGWYMRRWPILLSIEKPITPTAQSEIGNERNQCKWFRQYYNMSYAQICDAIEKDV